MEGQQSQETIQQYVERMIAEAFAGSTTRPQVPQVDHAPQTPEEAQALGEAFAAFRKEVADLRAELAAHKPRTVFQAQVTETPEQRAEARLAEIAEASHYCPGCGELSKYPKACRGECGRRALGSPLLEFASTDELGGDPARHTAAPSTMEEDIAAQRAA